MRMTPNKRAILEALSLADDGTCLEWGPPPRSASTVAAILKKPDHRPIARTLRNLERQGLVIAESQPIDVWCELRDNQGHFPKLLKCYWPATNQEAVRAKAAAWSNGKVARSEKAMDTLLALIARR